MECIFAQMFYSALPFYPLHAYLGCDIMYPFQNQKLQLKDKGQLDR